MIARTSMRLLATTTAVAALAFGAVATTGASVSAVGDETGTCASTGVFSASGTCTVLSGETVQFTITGGHGGAGGPGGIGGIGGSAFTGGSGDPGGFGGMGGAGGLGATIVGEYTNDSDVDVTLNVTVGASGVPGTPGDAGVDGVDGTINSPDGANGSDGGNGLPGGAGSDSSIHIAQLVGDPVLLVTAGAGGGGTGGTGGSGGDGATAELALVPAGAITNAPGANGVDGVPGEPGEASSLPSPLPQGWEFGGPGTPGVEFIGDAPAPTTTVAPSTTVAPTTTAASGQLPVTGTSSSFAVLLAMATSAFGVAMVLASRRRSAHQS